MGQQLSARHEQYLGEATPALAAAHAASASLRAADVLDILNAERPSPALQAVCVSAAVLLNGRTEMSFDEARDAMMQPGAFLNRLREFDGDGVSEQQVSVVQATLRKLDVEEVLAVSPSAGTLLMWTANMARYNQIYRSVRPVRAELTRVGKDLETADKERHEAAKKVSFLLAWSQK